ncbi:MAG: hypothetical protein KH373_07455 [Ruminococcus sp.]|nr:hypothetical protein [Ruminococcus sp.]
MNKQQRAHDLAISITKWQLDNIDFKNVSKDQPVKINVYAIYKRNYNEVLKTLNQDTVFDGEE